MIMFDTCLLRRGTKTVRGKYSNGDNPRGSHLSADGICGCIHRGFRVLCCVIVLDGEQVRNPSKVMCSAFRDRPCIPLLKSILFHRRQP